MEQIKNLKNPDESKAFLMDDYSRYYRRHVSDSPVESRTSMVKRIIGSVLDGDVIPPRVLNIGSGPQMLENQLLAQSNPDIKKKLKALQFVSLDIADISSQNLLAQERTNVNHVRGDATATAFKDNSFGLVVSNLAIDFAPKEEAFREAYRVLNHEGKAVFYLHHPSLLDSMEKKDEQVQIFWTYLKDNKILFNDEVEIRNFLEKIGFRDVEVILKNDKGNRNKWWEVVALKKEEIKQTD
jgi:SAM-dependent methyltransferase